LPRGAGATVPVRRNRYISLTTQLTLTENCRAAALHDSPLSSAATIRVRCWFRRWDRSAIDINIILQPRVGFGIGGELDRRRGLVAKSGAASGRERYNVGTGSDLTSDAAGIEAGAVHEYQPALGHRLRIFDDVVERRGRPWPQRRATFRGSWKARPPYSQAKGCCSSRRR
jgi:hypothetical protein